MSTLLLHIFTSFTPSTLFFSNFVISSLNLNCTGNLASPDQGLSLSPAEKHKIKFIDINGCIMHYLSFAQFPNLDLLYLNKIGITEFNFEDLRYNTALRVLDLSNNEQLTTLHGTADIKLHKLNLTNTKIGEFPVSLYQFEDSLIHLDIEESVKGFNKMKICTKFPKLEAPNGETCQLINSNTREPFDESERNDEISLSTSHVIVVVPACLSVWIPVIITRSTML